MQNAAPFKYCYQQYYPERALSNYVKFFYYFHGENIGEERVLPFGTTEIIVNLGADKEIYIANPATKHYHINTSGPYQVAGVSLHPWAFNSLFRIPQSEISNSKIGLKDILPAQDRALSEKLKHSTDHTGAIKILSDHLTAIGQVRPVNIVSDAMTIIDQKNSFTDMRTIYGHHKISERRFQQLFKEQIGMSPRKYYLLKRFHRAVTLLEPDLSLTDLALDLGYYDQAHFINEFKSFAGISPGAFLKEKNTLNQVNQSTYFAA
jgi:AraC-like DNA-binding protein